MKYKTLKNKITTDKYDFKFIGKHIIVGDNKEPCMICGEPTEFIDVYSEGYLCSTECEGEFYDMVSEHEKQCEEIGE